jgi:hypothetical protein
MLFEIAHHCCIVGITAAAVTTVIDKTFCDIFIDTTHITHTITHSNVHFTLQIVPFGSYFHRYTVYWSNEG